MPDLTPEQYADAVRRQRELYASDGQACVELTPFQQRVSSLPEQWNLFLGGGRGGGKSVAAQQMTIKHCEKYGAHAKVLYVRESWEALAQYEEDFLLLVRSIYGDAVKHNRSDHIFRWPNGATVKMSQIADEADYKKFQGKSFTLLIGDEYGAMTQPKWFWLIVSNMRGPKDMPMRVIILANPGGAQHGNIVHEYIENKTPWYPFEKDGSTWTFVPSTLLDNPHIDHTQYIRNLRVSCGNDEELLKAWISGDWNISRGAFFAGILDQNAHRLRLPPAPPKGQPPIISVECPYPLTDVWQPYIAHDWGSGEPSVTGLFGVSPGVPQFPKGSLILVDEFAAYDPTDKSWNVGLKYPPLKLAEGIKMMCHPWGVFPQGVGDDAYGMDDTLLHAFMKLGVYMIRPLKERVSGWQAMCEMLVAARDRTGQPGLYISERCEYFWKTVPYLQRDPKHPSDLMTKNVPDHGADMTRYGVMHNGRGSHSGGTEGLL